MKASLDGRPGYLVLDFLGGRGVRLILSFVLRFRIKLRLVLMVRFVVRLVLRFMLIPVLIFVLIPMLRLAFNLVIRSKLVSLGVRNGIRLGFSADTRRQRGRESDRGTHETLGDKRCIAIGVESEGLTDGDKARVRVVPLWRHHDR